MRTLKEMVEALGKGVEDKELSEEIVRMEKEEER